MRKYSVQVVQNYISHIVIEAENEADAKSKIYKMYDRHENPQAYPPEEIATPYSISKVDITRSHPDTWIVSEI